MAFDLAQTENIPQDILSVLAAYHELLGAAEFLDELLERQDIFEIADALNGLAEEAGVVGYHYTRSSRCSIEASGLISKSGEERRREFLEEYGDYFTLRQRERMEATWDAYFDERQNRVRDHRIWFNLTKFALEDGGAAPLLSNYGGEVVYMPLALDCEIAMTLASIGEPMVIRCSLDTKDLDTFSSTPWGKVWLSSYHRSVNPNAHQTDFDVYTTHPVHPERILSIEVICDDSF